MTGSPCTGGCAGVCGWRGRGRLETGPYARGDPRCAEDGRVRDAVPTKDEDARGAEDGRVSDAAPTKDWTGTRAGGVVAASRGVVRHTPARDSGAAHHERGRAPRAEEAGWKPAGTQEGIRVARRTGGSQTPPLRKNGEMTLGCVVRHGPPMDSGAAHHEPRPEDGRVSDAAPTKDGDARGAGDGRVSDAAPTQDLTGTRAGGVVAASRGVVRHAPARDSGAAHHERVRAPRAEEAGWKPAGTSSRDADDWIAGRVSRGVGCGGGPGCSGPGRRRSFPGSGGSGRRRRRGCGR